MTLADSGYTVIHPTEKWKTKKIALADPAAFKVDRNYYVTARNAPAN